MTRKGITTKDIGLCWHNTSDRPKEEPPFEIRYDEHLWQKYLPKGTVFEFKEMPFGMAMILSPTIPTLSVLHPEEYKIVEPSV
jgi:hypothetical protein